MQIRNTRADIPRNLKTIAFGPPKVGKTRLATTASRPLVINAEGGLLSVHDDGIDYVDVTSHEDVMGVYRALRDSEEYQAAYDWIILDSASEVAEISLAALKATKRDPRQAYGALYDEVPAMFRAFRDLPFDVCFVCKEERKKVGEGDSERTVYEPGVAADKLGQRVPYLFDEIFRLESREVFDKEGGSTIQRRMQTANDGRASCGDRSGKLDRYEPADLEAVRAKIFGPRAE